MIHETKCHEGFWEVIFTVKEKQKCKIPLPLWDIMFTSWQSSYNPEQKVTER